MTRRAVHRIVRWMTTVLLMGVMVSAATAWAQEGEGSSSSEESRAVVEETIEQATQQAEQAAQGHQELSEGEEPQGQEESESGQAEAQVSSSPRTLPQEETQVTGGTLVIVTYLILWGMLGLFLLVMMWRLARLTNEVEGLESRLDELLED